MNKLITILVLFFLCNYLFSQQTEIKWSPFGDKEKKEALKIADKFMTAYVDNDFQALQKYIPAGEINFGGDFWFQTQQFVLMVQSLRGKNELKLGALKAYTMDDTEDNPDIKEKTLKIYRMFSNFSIFISAETIDKTKNTQKTIYLNLNLDDNKNWIVSSFLDTSIGLADNTSFPKDNFRTETFDSLSFDILIPKDFSEGQKTGSQTTYILTGNTDRDAAIQIDNFELKAPLDILSYNWVQYIANQYEHYDILIKYMPYGYKYEYTVKDQDGNLNKGITTAFVSNDRFVYIQYFSFTEIYNKIWVDIDIMLRKLKVN